MFCKWLTRTAREKTLHEVGARELTLANGQHSPDADLVEPRLKAVLAEYDALNQQNEDRADFQHRILQFHIATLTVLATTFLIRPLNSTGSTRWLLFGIPFEASIFGLYWFDQAEHRWRIGRYLRWDLEPRVRCLLGGFPGLAWESERRGNRFISKPTNDEPSAWIVWIWKRLRLDSDAYAQRMQWTFGFPSVLVLITGFIYSVLNAPFIRELVGVRLLADRTANLFPMGSDFVDIRFAITLLLTLGGAYMWMFFNRTARSYWGLRSNWRENPPLTPEAVQIDPNSNSAKIPR